MDIQNTYLKNAILNSTVKATVKALLLAAFLSACQPNGLNTENQTAKVQLLSDLPDDSNTAPADKDPNVISERNTTVNLAAIYNNQGEQPAATGIISNLGKRNINLRLATDLNLNMVINKEESPYKENVIISGYIEDDHNSFATLVAKDGVLIGHIHYKGRKFEIRYSKSGVQKILELNPDVEEVCAVQHATAPPNSQN